MSLHTKGIQIALVFFLKQFFFKFVANCFTIGGKLFYHFVLVSALQQSKLAIFIYVIFVYITFFLSLFPLLE